MGDALTVIIAESANATNQTSMSTEKTNALQVGSQIPGAGNILDFIPLHALQSDASLVRTLSHGMSRLPFSLRSSCTRA